MACASAKFKTPIREVILFIFNLIFTTNEQRRSEITCQNCEFPFKYFLPKKSVRVKKANETAVD